MEEQIVVKEQSVVPIMQRAYCPDCDVELERDQIIINTFPPTFQYFCPKCGYGYTSQVEYPKVTFEEIKYGDVEWFDNDIES